MEKTWARYGASRTKPIEERFWEKVEKTDGCWLWRGGINSHGYGAMSVKRRTFYAHRYSLELALGRKLTPAEFACHTCDNRPCVRPDHLFVGSNSDNILDASQKGRLPRHQRSEWVARRMASSARTKAANPPPLKTHCPQGHPYDAANTVRYSEGHRRCHICTVSQQRARYWKRKNA